MAAPLRVEERLSSLEARMTAVEQLPSRVDRLASELRAEIRAGDEVLREDMRTGHVMILTALTEQIEESRRETRVLHEDVLGRIRVVGEGLAARDEKIDTLGDKIDTAQGENRTMFEQLLARIEAPRIPPKRKRR